MKVEELSSYKNAFDNMPLKAQFVQAGATFSELRKKLGMRGMIGFIAKVIRKRKQLKKQYGNIVQEKFADVPSSAIMELYLLSAMYLVLAEMYDEEQAYDLLKAIFHKIGPTAHEELYNLKGLLKCQGDVFTNFRKLNRSMFENSAKKGFYTIPEIEDSDNLQFLRVTKCLNVDAFSTLGCPELARLGCEGDRAGYAPEAMGNRIDLDFRRPATIAKGASSCEFYYYRKAHAPEEMETL